MTKRKIFIVIIVIATFFCNKIVAQKIAYLNNNKILNALPAALVADSMANKFEDEYYQEIEAKKDIIYKDWGNHVKDSAKFTPKQNRAQIDKYIAALQDVENKEKNDLIVSKKRNSFFEPVVQNITKTIQDYAKANGIQHIIYDGYAIILNNNDDITDAIIKKLLNK